LKNGSNQILMFPCESAKQYGDSISLLCLEGPLYGPMEVSGLIQTGDLAQPVAFRLQALFDFFVAIDLYEMSCHYLPPAQCALAFAVSLSFGLDIADRPNLFRAAGVDAETSEKKQRGWNESKNLLRRARQGFLVRAARTPTRLQASVTGNS
jgi:hypothetical protein